MTEQEQQEPLRESPESLCARVAAGDSVAEADLYRRYRRGVLFLLTQRSGDPELAADLAQDALMRVLAAVRNREIETPAALNGYVRQVAINLLIAHRRKQVRQNTGSIDPTAENSFPDERSESVLEHLKRDQLRPIVSTLLSRLSVKRDRDILERTFLHDEDKASICSRWNLTPSQFDTVIHRARQRLKALIEQQHEIRDLLDPLELIVATALLSAMAASAEPRPHSTEFVQSQHLQSMSQEYREWSA